MLRHTPQFTRVANMELQSELATQSVLSAIMAELGPGTAKKAISVCPECQKNSRVGHLKQYLVSLEDNVIFCDNDMCCFTTESLEDVQSANATKDNELDDLLTSLCNDTNSSSLEESSGLLFTEQTGLDELCNLNNSASDLFGSGDAHCLLTDSTSAPPSSECNALNTLGSNIATQTTNATSGSIPSSSCSVNSLPMDSYIILSSPESPAQHSNGSKSPNKSSALCSPEEPSTVAEIIPEIPQLTKTFSHRQSTYSYSHSSRLRYVMLWYNIDALCWLDVLLASLCHNLSLRKVIESVPYSSVVKKLLLAFDESQTLLKPLQAGDKSLLHAVMENNSLSVKRGGGHCIGSSRALLDSISKSTVLSGQEIESAKRKVHLAVLKLESAREEMWQFIEPQLKCTRGKDDSPVFAFPLIVRSNKLVEQLYLTDYCWTTRCTTCHHEQVERKRDAMITFPRIGEFRVNSSMVHYRDCIKCLAPNQSRKLTIDKFAPNLVIHFADGMNECDVDDMSFTSASGDKYMVSSVVEYRTSPNHFTLWHRDISQGQHGNWMCYDDLDSQYAQFSIKEFSVPADNIHIVFWEIHQSIGKTTPSATEAVHCIDVDNSLDDSLLQNSEKHTLETVASVYRSKQTISDTASRHVEVKASFACPAPPTKPTKSLNNGYSKLVTAGDKRVQTSHGTGHSGAKRKAVPLLSAPIKSQPRALTDTIRYGVSNAIDTSQGSYKDVMNMLSLINNSPVSASTTSKPDNQPSRKSRSISSTKSYLQIVQPLLLKHKEQKGTNLGGYVPKSKREAVTKSPNGKGKRVMFSGSPYFDGPTSVPPKTPHVPDNYLHCPTTRACPTRATRTKAKNKTATMLLSDDAIYPPRKVATKNDDVENEDMPSFEDMLKGL